MVEGEGIRAALLEGFEHIISFELLDEYVKLNQERWKDYPQVRIIQADTAYGMLEHIRSIRGIITFWLDGHSSGGSPKGLHSSPLMQELEQIRMLDCNTHSILIDDLNSWTKDNPEIGFDTNDIIAKVKKINPQYRIEIMDGTFKNDILAACISNSPGHP